MISNLVSFDFLLFQIDYHNPKTKKSTNQTSLKSF